VHIAVFAGCVLTELLCFLVVDAPHGVELLELLGLALIPACIADLAFTYLAERYGALPNIAYRLILTLLPFFTPTFPDAPGPLRIAAKILAPFALFILLHLIYGEHHCEELPKKSN
jgi:hypothetical protein